MKTNHSLTALLAACLLPAVADGQTCSVVSDINTITLTSSSSPQAGLEALTKTDEGSFVQLGSTWYLVAETLLHGAELWRTDGTAAGTTLVKDINPGTAGSNISWLTPHGGKLWFEASDGVHGRELWVSDGTAAGTHMVKDVNPGTPASEVDHIVGLGGKVYFSADDGTSGSELWGSDGTDAGTSMVLDIQPGAGSSLVSMLTTDPAGTKLLFRANDGVSGTELWESDGTAAGTALLKDIYPGGGSSNPESMVHHNGAVFMTAQDTSFNYELWKTDGTAAGTVLVKDIAPGFGSGNVDLTFHASLGADLYFSAGVTNGRELWKTDGTAGGTVEVLDISATGSSFPRGFVAHGGKVYFSADDNAAFGRELWVTDGTALGTSMVYDFNPGGADGFNGFKAGAMASHNGFLYLNAGDGIDWELWRTDGTAAGTVLLQDIWSGSSGSNPLLFTPITSTDLMFSATGGTAVGRELFVTDGTAAGTGLLVDIEANLSTADASPKRMHPVGGDYVLFLATDGAIGEELYRWDAATGVTLLKDVRPGPSGSLITGFTTGFLGGQLVTFFVADDGTSGSELWVTDGTAAGTHMVHEINPTGSALPTDLFFHPPHQALYLMARDGTNGFELWRTDGTAAGTWMVADINPSGSSYSGQFVDFGGDLYFRADNGVDGSELWRSDGTAAGTVMVADVYPGLTTWGSPNSSTPTNLAVLNGKLLFTADDGVHGAELWTSDGTAAGTSLVVDLRPGALSPLYDEFVHFNGALYFEADDGVVGSELFMTDGTAAGTVLVKDTAPGFAYGRPTTLTVAGGKLFFTAQDTTTSGRELWVSDGTTAGTSMVVDLWPGTGSSTPIELVGASNGVWFSASDGSSGTELWKSDGTAAGTTLACDIIPGIKSSNPTGLVLCDGDLLFGADDVYLGDELQAVAGVGAYSQDLGLPGLGGPSLRSTDPVLGSSITVSGEGGPVGSIGVLLMSAHVGTPMSFLTTPSSVSWMDLATYSILGVSVTPSWSITKPIPAMPSLAGVQVNLQAWYLPASTFPAETSNGLHLVVGS